MFARLAIPGADSSTPDRVLYDHADSACHSRFGGYVGDDYNDSDLDYDVLIPSDEQIAAGEKAAVCYVTLDDPRASSVKGSGTDSRVRRTSFGMRVVPSQWSG